MYYSATLMSNEFERKKNQRAFLYTAAIMGILLLLLIFIKWPKTEVKKPITEDFVEVSLPDFTIEQEGGGGGDLKPAAKGEPAPEEATSPQTAAQQDAAPPQTDDNETEKEAPVIAKNTIPVKNTTSPVTNPKPSTTPSAPAPKPAPKPRIVMPGGTGNGSGAGGDGDSYIRGPGNGSGTGNGTGPGNGSGTGGGNGNGTRPPSQPPRITKHYSFNGDLPKATIYANIKISPNGVGTFVSFGKNSTTTNSRYADDIRDRLRYMEFPKFERDYTQIVTFYYTEH